MKLYDCEFKDELNVTKAEAKHIFILNNNSHELALYVKSNKRNFLNNCYCLFFKDNALECGWGNTYFNTKLTSFGTGVILKEAKPLYKNYKWVLTNKLKQGDVLKQMFKKDKRLYVYDKKDTVYKMNWCWHIENNRPKIALCDKYMYKLVERQ